MANTVASPGSIVVPLSQIIEQLQGKLSNADIDNLLHALASRRITEVRPGDLIQAGVFNQLLNDVADLNVRVSALEVGLPTQGQGVVIVFPTASTTVNVGDALVIQGQNLLANSLVIIENTSVAGLIGSPDNTRLTIPVVPPVDVAGGLPTAGRQVRMTISNTVGQSSAVFVLRPAQIVRPIGTIVIAPFSGPTPGTVFAANGTYSYAFTITADTRPDETYLVSANINRAGWTATPSQSEIFIRAAVDARTPTIATVSVNVHIASNAQNGDTGQLAVTLAARSDSTFVFRSTPDIPIAVAGTATAPPSLNLALTATVAGQAATRLNTDQTRTALIGPAGGGGGTGQVNISVTNADGTMPSGNYVVDLAQLSAFTGDPNGRWQARLASTTGNQVTLSGAQPSFNVEVTAAANAPNATMIVPLTRANDSSITGRGEIRMEVRQ